MKRIIGGVLAAALTLSGCLASEGEGKPVEDYTCDDLAQEAADLGENSLGVSLLKVRDPRVTKDSRTSYAVPTGASEVTLLECRGTGVFSSGEVARVSVAFTMDADRDMFVSWQQVG